MLKSTYGAAVLAAYLALPGLVHAEARPQSGSRDHRVTYATYQEGQVYTVQTRVRNVTLIELGNGERIQSIAIGDSESFQIDKLEGANVFTVKPVIQGAATNMTVETNRRFYFINLVETSRGTPSWSVKFTVPGEGGSTRPPRPCRRCAMRSRARSMVRLSRRPAFPTMATGPISRSRLAHRCQAFSGPIAKVSNMRSTAPRKAPSSRLRAARNGGCCAMAINMSA